MPLLKPEAMELSDGEASKLCCSLVNSYLKIEHLVGQAIAACMIVFG